MVAAGIADEALVQVAYAIGVAKPVSLSVNTYGTSKVNLTDGQIAEKLNEIFDMRPSAIISRLGLTNPIFSPTAAYGHMGRESYTEKVSFSTIKSEQKGNVTTQTHTVEEREVEFFTWEKLDYVDKIKTAFKHAAKTVEA